MEYNPVSLPSDKCNVVHAYTCMYAEDKSVLDDWVGINITYAYMRWRVYMQTVNKERC